MFSTLIKRLVEEPANDPVTSRRRHPRRTSDHCICLINGTPYPVENWSLGGLLIHADGRLFNQSRNVDLKIKFKIGQNFIDIVHQARIVRCSQNRVAFEFLPLTQSVRHKFHNVIDRFVVGEFAKSQMG